MKSKKKGKYFSSFKKENSNKLLVFVSIKYNKKKTQNNDGSFVLSYIYVQQKHWDIEMDKKDLNNNNNSNNKKTNSYVICLLKWNFTFVDYLQKENFACIFYCIYINISS